MTKTNKERTHAGKGRHICAKCGKPIRKKKGESAVNHKPIMEYSDKLKQLVVVGHTKAHRGKCP